MKAKLILTAMAMPVLFAACSSDELVPMDQTLQKERPLLSENFKLTSKVEGNVDTRYSVTGNKGLTFSWNEGDQYGAGTIDEFDPNKKPADWDIIKSLAGTNAPFNYNSDGTWTSPIRIGVGHYIFTFPYNPEDNSRAAVSYELPAVQKLQNEKGEFDLNGAIKNVKDGEIGNKAVAAKLLNGEEESVEVTLRNLYSYPKFHILFDNGQAVTKVKKIALQKNSKFAVAGGFKHQAVVNLFKAGEKAAEKSEEAEEAYWKGIQTEEFLISETEATIGDYKGYTDYKESEYIIAEFPGVGGTPVQPSEDQTANRCIDARFMIPGALSADYSDLNMYIYTDNGIYKVLDVINSAEYKSTTTDAQKDRIFARNASNTVTLRVGAANKTTDIYLVSNAEDWKKLVKDYDKKDVKVDVDIVGEEFTLDASMPIPTKGQFTFEGDLTVTGEFEAPLTNITVDGSLIVAQGAVVSLGENFETRYITVEAGADVETRTTAEPGTLNITKDSKLKWPSNDPIPVLWTSEITNNGNVNVAADADAEFIIKNNVGGVFTNNGKATITLTNEGGTVDNNETMIISDTSENKVEDYDNADEEDDVAGTFNNNEGAELYGYSNFTNNSVFNQKGMVINFKNGDEGTFVPYSTASSSHFDETSGTLDLSEYFEAKSKFSGEKDGFTTIELTLETGESKKITELNQKGVNKLVINGGIVNGSHGDAGNSGANEKQYSGKVEIGVNGGSLIGENGQGHNFTDDIVIPKNLTVSYFTLKNVTVENGTLTISGNAETGNITLGSKKTVDGVEVVGTGKLVVNKDKNLTVEGLLLGAEKKNAVVQNNGTIKVLVKSDNKTWAEDYIADYTWSGNKPGNNGAATDAPKETKGKQAFMDDAVEQWAAYWSHFLNNGGNDAEYYAGNPYNYNAFAATMITGDPTGRDNEFFRNEYLGLISGQVFDTNGDWTLGFGADLFKKEETDVNGNGIKDYLTIPGEFATSIKTVVMDEISNPDAAEKDQITIEAAAKKVLYKNGTGVYQFKEISQNSQLFDDALEAEAHLLKELSVTNWKEYNSVEKTSAKMAAYVWYERQTTAATSLTTVWTKYNVANPYTYIWKGCPLDDVMNRYLKYSPDIWDAAFKTAGLNEGVERVTDMASLRAFYLKASLVTVSSTVLDVAKGIVKDYPELESWEYSVDQFEKYPVDIKTGTYEAAIAIVKKINDVVVYVNTANTQAEILDNATLKNLLNDFGTKTADADNADYAIKLAKAKGVELSDDAKAAWAHTPAVVELADDFVAGFKNASQATKAEFIARINKPEASLNPLIKAYYAGLGVTLVDGTITSAHVKQAVLVSTLTIEKDDKVSPIWGDGTDW